MRRDFVDPGREIVGCPLVGRGIESQQPQFQQFEDDRLRLDTESRQGVSQSGQRPDRRLGQREEPQRLAGTEAEPRDELSNIARGIKLSGEVGGQGAGSGRIRLQTTLSDDRPEPGGLIPRSAERKASRGSTGSSPASPGLEGGPSPSELELGKGGITVSRLADDPGRVAHPAQLVDRGINLVGIDQQEGLSQSCPYQSGQGFPGQQFLGENGFGGADDRHVPVQLDGNPGGRAAHEFQFRRFH